MTKRSTIVPAVLALVLGLWGLPTFAQGRGGGGGQGPGGPPMTPGGNHGSLGNAGPSAHAGSETTTGKRTMSDLLTQNTKLASKISDLTGMDAQQACSGFRNLGQCVAAAHVSKNLGINFNTLKGKVTGSGAENLGQAIHGLQPNVNAKSEAKKGQKQAHLDIKQLKS
jgi:hypothetical protein